MCSWCSDGMSGWGMMGWGMVSMWLVIALVIAAIWRWSRSARDGGWPSRDAEQVVRERYARGEIDDATYQRMVSQLGGEGARSGRALQKRDVRSASP